MPERPPDPLLEASTVRWMQMGIVVMVALVLAFPIYRLFEPSNRDDAAAARTANLANQGRDLYEVNCAACHGLGTLVGVAPVLNSVQFLSSVEDVQIRQLTAVGIPGTQMSAYLLDFGGPLTVEQIRAIATYLRSLEPTAPDVPGWRDPAGL